MATLREEMIKLTQLFLDEYEDVWCENVIESLEEGGKGRPINSYLVDLIHYMGFENIEPDYSIGVKTYHYVYVSDAYKDLTIEVIKTKEKNKYVYRYELWRETKKNIVEEEYSTKYEFRICTYLINQEKFYDFAKSHKMKREDFRDMRRDNVMLEANENMTSFAVYIADEDDEYVCLKESDDFDEIKEIVRKINNKKLWEYTYEKCKKKKLLNDLLK